MRMMLLAAAAVTLAGCTRAAEPPPEPAAASHSPEYLERQRLYAAAPTPTITAITPTPGVPRSLHITGTAPAIWFTENQFPIALADRSGKVLHAFSTRVVGENPDLDQPVPWDVDLRYAEGETPAMVILKADQAGGFDDDEEGGPPTPVYRLPLAVTPPKP